MIAELLCLTDWDGALSLTVELLQEFRQNAGQATFALIVGQEATLQLGKGKKNQSQKFEGNCIPTQD